MVVHDPNLQRLQLSQLAQPSMRRADFSGHDMTKQWRKLQFISFSKKCCLYATRRRKELKQQLKQQLEHNIGLAAFA
jgi:hypothetical protein